MIRKLKILGLSLVALFATSATLASMAAAADFDVETSAADPVTVTSTQKTTHTFEITERVITCEVVRFEGTTNNPTPTSIKMAAEYGECRASGINMVITNFATDDSEIGNFGKCWYRLDADGGFALECNGTEVTFGAATCAVHIPAQEFDNVVSYSTETLLGGKHDLEVAFDIEGMTANHTDGFLCPFNGSGEGKSMNYHGTSTAFAESEATGELRHITHTP